MDSTSQGILHERMLQGCLGCQLLGHEHVCKHLGILGGQSHAHALQHHHPNLEDVARTSVVAMLIQSTRGLIPI